MKDEIKEILDYLAFLEDIDTQKKVKQVLDYITNLQQENKEANDSITWWANRFNAVQRDYENYKSRCEKANKLLQNILVVRDWEHEGRFRPVKNTSAQDVYKAIIMLNELFETPYRMNYGLLQGVDKDE